MTSSVQSMLQALDAGCIASSDEPDAPAPVFGERVSDGGRGRPPVSVDANELAVLSAGRTTRNQLANLYNCSARTIRRRLVEYGLSAPGPPVYIQEEQPDGTIQRRYFAGSSSDLSQISDTDLDRIILGIYQQFPSFGRRMIDGYLMQLGERVPRSRVLQSYLRVVGPSRNTFGPRRIQRQVYSVPGPNSLWHHDGQHG